MIRLGKSERLFDWIEQQMIANDGDEKKMLEAICFAKDHHFQHEAINEAIRVLLAQRDGGEKQ